MAALSLGPAPVPKLPSPAQVFTEVRSTGLPTYSFFSSERTRNSVPKKQNLLRNGSGWLPSTMKETYSAGKAQPILIMSNSTCFSSFSSKLEVEHLKVLLFMMEGTGLDGGSSEVNTPV